MHFQKLTVLASALLAQEALAGSAHRYAHRDYHEKKDVVYAHTEVETVVDWVTVTVWDPPASKPTKPVSIFKGHHSAPPPPPAPTTTPTPTTSSTSSSSSSSSTSTSVSSPPPAPVVAAPATTLATSVKPQVQVAQVSQPLNVEANVNVGVSAGVSVGIDISAKPSATPSSGGSTGGSTSGGKRGLAYNSGSLLSTFLSTGSKCAWSYNWDQKKDPLAPDTVEFVPMMWGPGANHEPTWDANAKKAIAAGAKNLLSFNECDHPSQCNMSPADTAAAHIRLMNPYQGQARISAPSITNSGSAGQGIDWLKQFITACNGKCAIDFCTAHWYSPADPDSFLSHMVSVHEACGGKPVWITEFAPSGSDDEIDAFLQKVMNAMDNDSKYSFIERYSYFMVGPGSMLNSAGTSMSKYGKTFAYGS